ncbi:WxL domain-containing protein [Salirhabdus sp. Marseille-P4669]|uniref:WxL domain-containing protein n=1 Tax=Salirhabdus sp. Marseille-P4669 TaxID=2042310 RepID=UPI000C7A57D1|nr:WxL domain-containing protein [Salirhabdus sp. Marseille-P4669]
MVQFKKHEIITDEQGNIEVRLFLDTNSHGLEEFSTELGERPDKQNIKKSALEYLKRNLPGVKYNKIKVMIGGAVIASILGFTLVPPHASSHVFAEEISNTTSTMGISGGALQVEEFTVGRVDVTLTGATQDVKATISDFDVIDPSGTGAGWNVHMLASQFTDASGNTLPTGSLEVDAPTLTAESGSSSAASITKSGGTLDNGTGVTILSAPTGEGKGTFTVNFGADALNLKLLPKDVKAGTYTSTITVTIDSGPGNETTTDTPVTDGTI